MCGYLSWGCYCTVLYYDIIKISLYFYHHFQNLNVYIFWTLKFELMRATKNSKGKAKCESERET